MTRPCAFNHVSGEYTTFPNACEAECAQAWVIAEGDCDELPVYGCTDEDALNYNPDATDDDGLGNTPSAAATK